MRHQRSGQSINRFDQTPYAMEWNFGIEQLLPGDIKLSVDYVGSGGRRLVLAVLAKYGPFWGQAALPRASRCTMQQRFPTELLTGHSNYHSLQVKLERSFKSGLTFMNSFTWSKSLGNTERVQYPWATGIHL